MQYFSPKFFYSVFQLLLPWLNRGATFEGDPLSIFDKGSKLYNLTLWLDHHTPFPVVGYLKMLPLIRLRGLPTRPVVGYDILSDCLENLFILLTYLLTLPLWFFLFWYSVVYSYWVIYIIILFYVINLSWSLKVLLTFYVKLFPKKYNGILFYDFSPEFKDGITNSPRTPLEAFQSIYLSSKLYCLIHFFSCQDYFVTSNKTIFLTIQQIIALIFWNYKLFSAFPIFVVKNLTLFFIVLWKGSGLSDSSPYEYSLNMVRFRHPCWERKYVKGLLVRDKSYRGFHWKMILYSYSYILCASLEGVQLLLYDKKVLTLWSSENYCTELLVPDSFELQTTRYNDDGTCHIGLERPYRHLKTPLISYNLLGFKILVSNLLIYNFGLHFESPHIPYKSEMSGYDCSSRPSIASSLKFLNLTFPICLTNLFKLYLKHVLLILLQELKIDDFTLIFNGDKFISWPDVHEKDVNCFVNKIDSFYTELLCKNSLEWLANQTSYSVNGTNFLDKAYFLVDDTVLLKDAAFNFHRREYDDCAIGLVYGETRKFSIMFSSSEHLLLFSTYLIDYDPLEVNAFLNIKDEDC